MRTEPQVNPFDPITVSVTVQVGELSWKQSAEVPFTTRVDSLQDVIANLGFTAYRCVVRTDDDLRRDEARRDAAENECRIAAEARR